MELSLHFVMLTLAVASVFVPGRATAQRRAIGSTRQAPALAGATATSSRDRVYTGDQTSNTVSVIDAGTNTFLGTIALGDPRPGVLGPLFALVGAGVGVMAVPLASALVGTWVYGTLRPRLPH